jgi:hypothetical protein
MRTERLPVRHGPRTGVSSTVWCVVYLAAPLLVSALMTLGVAHVHGDFYAMGRLFTGILLVPTLIAVAVFRRWLDRRKP